MVLGPYEDGGLMSVDWGKVARRVDEVQSGSAIR